MVAAKKDTASAGKAKAKPQVASAYTNTKRPAVTRQQSKNNAQKEKEAKIVSRVVTTATLVPGGAAVGAVVKGARAASVTKKVYEANRSARLAKGTVTKTVKATQGKKATITAKTPAGAKYSPTKGTTVKIEKKSRPQAPFASLKRRDTLVEKNITEGRRSGARTGALMGAIASESYHKGRKDEKKSKKK